MEYLSRLLKGLKEIKCFHYHPRCAKLNISHLCFADDLLLFAREDTSSTYALRSCFQTYSHASGLLANLGKSSVYFGGVTREKQDKIIQILGFSYGELPFKCLGVPLATKKISLIQWQPLLDRITSQISSWTTKNLSYTGQAQLIKSEIFGIQAYWAQLLSIPAKVLHLIDAHCRSYLCDGSDTITKKALVAWEYVCNLRCVRDLNLINISLWNKTALAKSLWDIANKQDKIWIRWIHTCYIKGQQLEHIQISKQTCWLIRSIFGSQDMLQQIPICQPGKSMIRHIYYANLKIYARISWNSI